MKQNNGSHEKQGTSKASSGKASSGKASSAFAAKAPSTRHASVEPLPDLGPVSMPQCDEVERMETRRAVVSANDSLSKTKATFADKIEKLKKR